MTASFDDMEMYRTYTYWFNQQFPNVNNSQGMIVHVETFDTRQFLFTHTAWLRG